MKEVIYLKSFWLDEIEQKINEKLLEGYVPYDSLVINKAGEYIQAIVKL